MNFTVAVQCIPMCMVLTTFSYFTYCFHYCKLQTYFLFLFIDLLCIVVIVFQLLLSFVVFFILSVPILFNFDFSAFFLLLLNYCLTSIAKEWEREREAERWRERADIVVFSTDSSCIRIGMIIQLIVIVVAVVFLLFFKSRWGCTFTNNTLFI